MKLRFTPRALENISPIADYIRFHNPAAAQRVRAAIYESLRDLILFPQVGRLQQTEGVRKFVTPHYAYLIYYTVDDAAGEIIILSVKHSAQKRDHEDA
jgi:plasmid stabilization system protein ParE